MSGPVTYSHKDSIAVIQMDDGKVNALGPTMQRALNEAIDKADGDNVGALVIAGNERVFSGGFDLKVLTSGEVQPAIDMLRGGFELAHRLLSYPKPVVMACTGHAIAMGAFLLSSGDHRVAAHAYNIQANEVAIGMIIPYAALEIMKLRLTRSAYQQATAEGQLYALCGIRVTDRSTFEDYAGPLRNQTRDVTTMSSGIATNEPIAGVVHRIARGNYDQYFTSQPATPANPTAAP